MLSLFCDLKKTSRGFPRDVVEGEGDVRSYLLEQFDMLPAYTAIAGEKNSPPQLLPSVSNYKNIDKENPKTYK